MKAPIGSVIVCGVCVLSSWSRVRGVCKQIEDKEQEVQALIQA